MRDGEITIPIEYREARSFTIQARQIINELSPVWRQTTGNELAASYQRAFEALEECSALTKVGLSPTAATISAIFIVAREGLEAVIILAALLAGLRRAENAGIRKRIGVGAWLALGVTAVVFVASRTLLQRLSHYGEALEAVISIVAVVVLLIVTNWVFHKYYWTGPGCGSSARRLNVSRRPVGKAWLSLGSDS